MSIQESCCVTGHRDIPPNQLEFVEKSLSHEIRAAIDEGITHFIFGGADGTDLLFARLVTEFQQQGFPLTLEAVIPYANRLKNSALKPLLSSCSQVTVTAKDYSAGCFFARNREMVQKSARVLAVYDGRQRGGTFFTLHYARSMGRDLRIIHL